MDKLASALEELDGELDAVVSRVEDLEEPEEE